MRTKNPGDPYSEEAGLCVNQGSHLYKQDSCSLKSQYQVCYEIVDRWYRGTL